MSENLKYLVEDYVETVIEEYDLDLDEEKVEIKTTRRLSRAAGNCRKRGDGYLIKISTDFFEKFGWDDTKAVIRHEIGHVVAYERLPFHSERGVGFREILDELDAPQNSPGTPKEPKYVLRCQDCMTLIKRFRKSEVVKNYELYNCGSCGGQLKRVK